MMGNLDRFSDETWDRFFEFVSLSDESLSREQVQEELRKRGINVHRAVSRVKQILKSHEARHALEQAKMRRPGLVAKLEQIAASGLSATREQLRQLIEQKFEAAAQAAYFRKLETASDEDLQSILEDIHRLEALSEEGDDAGSSTE